MYAVSCNEYLLFTPSDNKMESEPSNKEALYINKTIRITQGCIKK